MCNAEKTHAVKKCFECTVYCIQKFKMNYSYAIFRLTYRMSCVVHFVQCARGCKSNDRNLEKI